MSTDVSNSDDVIDSRDVIARIVWLTDALAEQDAEYADWDVAPNADERAEMVAELQSLQALADEASDYAADWEYGETLIRDSYFVDYAREMVEDCGYFSTDRSEHSRHGETYAPDFSAWPYRCIDWELVAKELQQDYTAVDFDGVTYWVR